MRIKEMIRNERQIHKNPQIHKFSLSAPQEMQWEQYGEYAYWR